jgi:hypothetical protein
LHDLAQIILQICIRVGVAIREVNGVIGMLKIVGKCVRIVKALISAFLVVTFTNLVLVVRNFGPSSMPADILRCCNFLAIDENFHTLIIKGIWFAQVQHIEADFCSFRIIYPEKEPLSMSACINVILQ